MLAVSDFFLNFCSLATVMEMKLSKSCSKLSAKEKCKVNRNNHFGKSNDIPIHHPLSPRRLTKQVALESPPHMHDTEENFTFYKNIYHENRGLYTCQYI